MQLKIKRVTALAPGLESPQQWQQWAQQNDANQTVTWSDNQVTVPKLDFVPMMQRRRLSKFARLCCYTLHQLNLKSDKQTQLVFTSRFGDLQKTTELIDNVVDKEALSPAQFGLSVHNAVAGQYSLFTNNKQPSTTISAGEDSFHMGLVDAIARLTQSDDDELLMVCTETIVPSMYTQYIEHQEIEHSVALLLSKTEGLPLSLTMAIPATPTTPSKQAVKPLPQAMQFMAWFYSEQPNARISSAEHQWDWQKQGE